LRCTFKDGVAASNQLLAQEAPSEGRRFPRILEARGSHVAVRGESHARSDNFTIVAKLALYFHVTMAKLIRAAWQAARM